MNRKGAMLRIRDVYPRSRIRIFFPHAGSQILYGFPQAFYVSKEASTAERRYEKERHSERLNVGKLHLVHGRICPLPPQHTRLL